MNSKINIVRYPPVLLKMLPTMSLSTLSASNGTVFKFGYSNCNSSWLRFTIRYLLFFSSYEFLELLLFCLLVCCCLSHVHYLLLWFTIFYTTYAIVCSFAHQIVLLCWVDFVRLSIVAEEKHISSIMRKHFKFLCINKLLLTVYFSVFVKLSFLCIVESIFWVKIREGMLEITRILYLLLFKKQIIIDTR